MKFNQYFFLHNVSDSPVYYNNMGLTQVNILKNYIELMYIRNKFNVYKNPFKFKPYKYSRYFFTFTSNFLSKKVLFI